MNTLNTITTLAYLCLISAHMGFVPHGKKCTSLGKALDKVLGTPKETPEKITKVLKSHSLQKCSLSQHGDIEPEDTYRWYLTKVAKTTRADVAQVMMSKLVVLLPPELISVYYGLAVKAKYSLRGMYLTPGSEDHKFVISCLANWQTNLSAVPRPNLHFFDDQVKPLILNGDLARLKMYTDHGAALPRCVSYMRDIKENQFDMAMLLFEHPGYEGYTAANSPYLLANLFNSENFTVAHLEGLLKKGFLKEKATLEMAIRLSSYDQKMYGFVLALLSHGVRLDACHWKDSRESSTFTCAKYLAALKTLPHVQATLDPDSRFHKLPAELQTFIHQKFINDVSRETLEMLIDPAVEEN